MIHHSKPDISNLDLIRVNEVIKSGMLSTGDITDRFELECSKFLNQKKSITTKNGTTAIYNALYIAGVSIGDEVIIPSYICSSVLSAILHLKAKPIFCDLDTNWILSSSDVEKKINSKTKAIIVNHTFGIKADIRKFLKFGVFIIEDCCQAFAKEYGVDGDIATYSFQATKCLTTGEGGLISYSYNSKIDINKDEYKFIINNRLSNLESALGLSQLDKYSSMLQRRKEIAELYINEISSELVNKIKDLQTRSIFFRFPLWVNKPFEELKSKFYEKGVSVRRGVDELLHRKFNFDDKLFPNTVSTFEHTLSIPIYSSLTDEEIYKVIEVSKSILK